MEGFKTPQKKCYVKEQSEDSHLHTPIKIPPSPFLQQIGYGCGVKVLTLERSPRVGFIRSPWALKKRNSKLTKDQIYDDRIQLEAGILRKLNHPNIVGFRAVIKSSGGDMCLAMEHLDISLGDMIEDRQDNGESSFPAKDILKIGYEVAKGLKYLHHTAYILHGDIKSYNILVSKDFNKVKLCDFGVSMPLAKSLEVDTSQVKAGYIGTECWTAPEILFEKGPITNKADIWSYGLVFWEMIALSPPNIDSSVDKSLSTDNDSILEISDHCNIVNTNDDSTLPNKVQFKLGVRPPLPAVDLDTEYEIVLHIFYICTISDYKQRPSAEDINIIFEKCVYIEEEKKSNN